MDRTGNRFDSREPIAAVANMVIEMGSILIPVCRASRPSTSCRYSGHDEEDTHQDEVLAEQPDQPRPHRRDPGQGEMHQRVGPVASRWRCQVTNPHSSTPPAAMTNNVSDKPNGSTGEFFGLTQPHVLDCRTAEDDQTPSRRRTAPRRRCRAAEPGPLRGASATCRVMARMNTDQNTSPTNTTRQRQFGRRPAAHDRADRDPRAGDPADDRVRGLAPGPRSCRRSAPRARGKPATRRCPRAPTTRGRAPPPTGTARSAPSRSRR